MKTGLVNNRFFGDGLTTFGNIPMFMIDPVWDDLQMPVLVANIGSLKAPTFEKVIDNGVGSTGVYAYKFADNKEQELFFSLRMPPEYCDAMILESCLIPDTDNSGLTNWGLEYTYTVNNVYQDTTILTAETNINNSYNKDVPLYFDLSNIDTSLRTTFLCRIFREYSKDTFVGKIGLAQLDLHYNKEMVGSTEMLSV